MKITFGLALDGYESPEPKNSIGEFITGPSGFLEVLETRLGLGSKWPTQALRVVQYQQCLEEAANSKQMFYSSSFEKDALAVSQTLLGWRDEWLIAGWNGTSASSDSKRLRDMAEVEMLARQKLGAGVAERLQSVIAALDTRQPGIAEVCLTDPLNAFPKAWQDVLNRLPITQAAEDKWENTTAEAGSDLASLQNALLNNTTATIRGDGSLFVIEAHNDHTLSRTLGECLGNADAWGGKCTSIITGKHGAALDDGLKLANLPITGSSNNSQWRPATQVLRLALSLLWKPLDPHRLLEFLTHPVCPVRQPLRSNLAKVVANTPGLGGPDWSNIIEKARTYAIEQADGNADAGKGVIESIKTWLTPERFDPSEGALAAKLAEHCARVARWAAKRANMPNITDAQKSSLVAAQMQAASAVEAIDEIAKAGSETLTKLQLERLIDQVTSCGGARPDINAECGHINVLRDAAAAIEPVERVVWWDFSPPDLPHKWPWTPDEIEQLRNHGVTLSSVDNMLQLAAKTWLRPVMAATRQLVLVMPKQRGIDAFKHHPLWDQILVATKDTQIPKLNIDQHFESGNTHPWMPFNSSVVEYRELPKRKRWWRVNDGDLLSARELESYSSLSNFIHTPHKWVLYYKAKLSQGSLANIDEGNRLKGSLIHRLFEWLFTSDEFDWRTATEESLKRWIGDHFSTLLEQEGANYLLPGKGREAASLQATAISAAWALVGHLRSAQVHSVEMEKHVEGAFFGGAIAGNIDMLISSPDEGEAVLDLKWGWFKYRKQELQENRQLQLAVYSVMRQQSTHRWPSEAYFILDEGRMAAQNNYYFEQATVCTPQEEYANSQTLWAAFRQSWDWRRAQLDGGIIEINVEGIESDQTSVPPDGALSIDKANDRFDDYIHLTGWPKEA